MQQWQQMRNNKIKLVLKWVTNYNELNMSLRILIIEYELNDLVVKVDKSEPH